MARRARKAFARASFERTMSMTRLQCSKLKRRTRYMTYVLSRAYICLRPGRANIKHTNALQIFPGRPSRHPHYMPRQLRSHRATTLERRRERLIVLQKGADPNVGGLTARR